MQNTALLFQPITIGANVLRNRIIMSPLTRCRAVDERTPNDLMLEYYSQRASAGLILTEATSVDAMGVGYPNTPGIWSEKQVEAWKKITKAVHEKGGKIFLQLWHVGRVSDPFYLDGKQPLAPSAIAAKGNVSLMRPKKEYDVPKALSVEEIQEVVGQFKKGAENAKLAGFDGVEVHGANGYLLDQFLQDSANKREDEYGGSLENRMRFPLQVLDAVIGVWGAERVGYHISPLPGGDTSLGDSNPLATYIALMKEFAKRKIAFVFARSPQSEHNINVALKQAFGGVFIANQGLTKEVAEQLLNEGKADAASFGQPFIANPDLVERFALNAELNKPNPATYYASGAEGYIDYPFLAK